LQMLCYILIFYIYIELLLMKNIEQAFLMFKNGSIVFQLMLYFLIFLVDQDYQRTLSQFLNHKSHNKNKSKKLKKKKLKNLKEKRKKNNQLKNQLRKRTMMMMNQKKKNKKIHLTNYHHQNSILMTGKDNSWILRIWQTNSNGFGKTSMNKVGLYGKLFTIKLKEKELNY